MSRCSVTSFRRACRSSLALRSWAVVSACRSTARSDCAMKAWISPTSFGKRAFRRALGSRHPASRATLFCVTGVPVGSTSGLFLLSLSKAALKRSSAVVLVAAIGRSRLSWWSRLVRRRSGRLGRIPRNRTVPSTPRVRWTGNVFML